MMVAKIALLISVSQMSRKRIESTTSCQYTRKLMSMLDDRNTYPANTPQKVLSTVRHGTVINAPRYFGASVNSTGSRPITRKASISSVTTIVPTSAAIADAVRPLTASAVISAPNSLVKLCLLYTSDAADERSSVDLG